MKLLDLGLVPYDQALELQHRLVEAVLKGGEDTLLLLEHTPVITLGRRAKEGHVLYPREYLAEKGIQVQRADRGGDVTYHGPGQLVGYPILDLGRYRKDVSWYVWSLEEVLIRALASFGLAGERREGLTGVWMGERKVAAIGLRIKGWVSYHGFALNVSPDMRHFELIRPCGLEGRGVTSMAKELGYPPAMEAVKERVAECFGQVFQREVERVPVRLSEREKSS